ncbi:MAG: hypothetical protein V1761_00425, partial [bacterium]
MNLVANRRGMSLTAVLGIVAFTLAAISSIFVLAYGQARYVTVSIEKTEAYFNAVEKVEKTMRIIVRDQNLDAGYLLDLATYMGVTISQTASGVYAIVDAVTATRAVTSYIAYDEGVITTYDAFLSQTGTEPGFTLNPLITPTTLLSAYMTDFVSTEYGLTAPAFTTFDSIVAYLDTVSGFINKTVSNLNNPNNVVVSGNWYVSGNVAPKKNLTVSPGYLLVINGNLTMKANTTISGNVIINGNVTWQGTASNQNYLYGTLYIDGSLTTNARLNFGTTARGPSFVFAAATVDLGTTATGIVYVLCHDFLGNGSGVNLDGGVYTSGTALINTVFGIGAYPDLNTNL